MAWEAYNLDRKAQQLVLKYRDREGVLKESHKMRVTVAYGLERFWGEHLRLLRGNDTKHEADYWKDTWKAFVEIVAKAGIEVPKGDGVKIGDTASIKAMAAQLWDQEKFPLEDQRISLAVLTQLCDSLVWWTQRYKQSSKEGDYDE